MSDTAMSTITASQAAAILDLANADVANRTLRRWGVTSVGRDTGRGGENLYDEERVLAAAAARPRRGRPATTLGPNTVTLRMRCAGQAIQVAVDLDRLTLRARVLAEVMAAQPGDAATDMILEYTRGTRAEQYPPEQHEWFFAEELASPDHRAWRHFSPARLDRGRDIHAWLEYEASCLPHGYLPLRPLHGPAEFRPPSFEAAAAADELLTRDQTLSLLRILGRPVSVERWFELQREGAAPAPTQYVAGSPRWAHDTIVAWARG